MGEQRAEDPERGQTLVWSPLRSLTKGKEVSLTPSTSIQVTNAEMGAGGFLK